MAKKSNTIKTIYLFIGGTLLFSLAWLMQSFPLLALIGFAAFIAIAVNNRKEKSIWSSLELVLLGLSISFFSASFFAIDQLSFVLIQAIVFTFSFVGYTFVRKSLGVGVSLLTLPLFWLSIEYLLLKWSPIPIYFLADLFILKSEWTRWNQHTGYLGASLWVLLCNTLLFQAVLTEKKVNWILVALFAVCIIIPIIYSLSINSPSITKVEMLQQYASQNVINSPYAANGEFIPRTTTWVSVLILLFTLVKRKTTKK